MAKQITFKQFERRLRRADKKLLKTLQIELTKLAFNAERLAKKNATDYPKVRTGRLRASITGFVDAKRGNPRMFLRAGGDTTGSPVNYARYIEFGAPNRNIAARLFMGRAIKQALTNAPTELRNVLSITLGKDK